MNKHGCYLGADKDKILDFSYNINHLKLEPGLFSFLCNQMAEVIYYPDMEGETSAQAVARYLDISSQQVMMGNGAIEILYLYARVMGFQRVLLIAPTFTEYERAFLLSGAQVFYEYYDKSADFAFPMAKVRKKLAQEKIDALLICNPNNPTGSYLNEDEIRQIRAMTEAFGATLILDESFIEFTGRKGATFLWTQERFMTLRSMTKFYAIPGLRLGYGIMPKDIKEKLRHHQVPWGMNTLALSAVSYLLNHRGPYEKARLEMVQNRAYMKAQLSSFPFITCASSEANFLLCHISEGAGALWHHLRANQIVVRRCEDFKGLSSDYFRLCVKERKEIDRLIQVLNQF